MDSSLFWKPKININPPKQYILQNKIASSYEYYVAIAAEKYGYEYIFQYAIMGGWGRPGGQVIDFIIMTNPRPTPLEVNEEHWHRDVSHEIIQQADIKALLGNEFEDLKVIWGEECDTIEKAEQAFRRLFVL
ncbi:MAG: hypothetical protein GYA51_04720 [Candidatus Methanofastidiosa archaeon]|nr:hypothetical protein [Candidatus Methanofastidiosa archaeon]